MLIVRQDQMRGSQLAERFGENPNDPLNLIRVMPSQGEKTQATPCIHTHGPFYELIWYKSKKVQKFESG